MDYVKQHAKALAALAAAILSAVVPALYSDAPLGFAGWVNVIILGAGAVQVYNSENTSAWNYGKLIAAAVSAGAVTALSVVADGAIARSGWIQVALAILAVFTVYRLPNAQKPGKHEAPETGAPPTRSAEAPGDGSHEG